MTARPLFIFGIARSGTNLIARMVGAHSRVSIALDPLLPFFKALRNALVRERGGEVLRNRFEPNSPFQDFYQKADAPELLQLMLEADLELAVPSHEVEVLRKSIVARAALESGEHARIFQDTAGHTYREIVANMLQRIAETAGLQATFAGVKEVWTTEFVPALARSFPDALFISIERDPRDVLISLEKLAESDPTQAAHGVSYMRHWRKHTVLSRHFLRDPNLSPRMHLVKFESLAAEPELGARAICEFLGVDFEPSMTRLEEIRDAATGNPWQGNSSFEPVSGGISSRPVGRWRRHVTNSGAACTYLCGPEMGIAGYTSTSSDRPGNAVLDYVLRAHASPGSWRSDGGDPVADFGFELMRHELLDVPADAVPMDVRIIQRCFLFQWVFDALRLRASDPAASPTRAHSP